MDCVLLFAAAAATSVVVIFFALFSTIYKNNTTYKVQTKTEEKTQNEKENGEKMLLFRLRPYILCGRHGWPIRSLGVCVSCVI